MNKLRMSEYQYKILNDTSLTSFQVSQLIFMTPGTVRYHRNKLGIRYDKYRTYGIIRKKLVHEPHRTIVMTLPIKQVSLLYQVSDSAIKEARRVIRQQSN